LFRVDRDAFSEIHRRKLFAIPPLAKLSPEMRPQLRGQRGAEPEWSDRRRVQSLPWVGRHPTGAGPCGG
jgi:hypothetical protein